MLDAKIEDALNKQLNAELFSSYLYLSMSACFEACSFRGMSNWMRIQSQEEYGHAMRIYDFINDRNGRVTLTQIAAPKTEWDSPLVAFEETYKHEQKVTAMISELMNLATAQKDHATYNFLEWFAAEQVEEEAAASTIVDQLKLVGDNGVALFMLDQQFGQRTAPSAAAAGAGA